MTQREQLYVQLAGLACFSLVVVAVTIYVPCDEKLCMLFAGILGNFSGSLLTMLRISGAMAAERGLEPKR